LVVSPIVIRELNKQKDFPKSEKIRDRASAALRRLNSWSDQTPPVMVRDSVELILGVRDPLIDFAAFQLSRDVSDDYLIAALIEHRTEHIGCSHEIVTDDLGLKLKAKASGFSVVRLPEETSLPDETLASEKRIRELDEQVRRLRSISPALRLVFESEEDWKELDLSDHEELTPEIILDQLAGLRRDHPKMSDPQGVGREQAGIFFDLAIAGVGMGISAEDVNKYNSSLDKYFTAYERYLYSVREFNDLRRRTARLEIVLVNDGTCPAEDIDIFLHFPDGFELFNKDELPKEPEAPRAPTRPKTWIEKASQPMFVPGFHAPELYDRLNSLNVPITPPNVSRPSIRRTNSYDVEVGIMRAKHGMVQPLDPLYITFSSFTGARSFAIDYTIHAANLPDPAAGKLHVVVGCADNKAPAQ
jgi:hypothetical protein